MLKQNEYVNYPLRISLDELIKQTENAATRTRWTMVILVLASVLIGIGFYNTTPFSFAPESILSLNKFENIPANNLAIKNCQKEKKLTDEECENTPLPLLDIYFGEHDFKDTTFVKGYNPFYRDGNFGGLRRFVCNDIYYQQKAVDTLGKYIYDSLNNESKKLLEECEKDKLEFPKNPTTFKCLIRDLNRLLGDKYLYSDHRFKSIKIENEETRHLLNEWRELTKKTTKEVPTASTNANYSASTANQNNKSVEKKESAETPSENEFILSSAIRDFDLARFNRLLLEAAFPGEINLSADIIPPREERMARELATHLAFDENVRFVNIPFFDTSIEVNDLGAFGGVGLIIILLLLRFNLSREIKNLNISFRQAFYLDRLATFYHQLAMRTIFVIPKMEGESVNQTLSAGAKYVCFLPVIVITLGVLYDWYSIQALGLYPSDEVFSHLLIEDMCVVIIWYLSFRCLERLTHIDEIWEGYHEIWEYYLKQGRESHKALISESEILAPKLEKAIENRVNNKSRHGRFRHSKSKILRAWGAFWIGRFLSLKTVARLMPFKPLRKFTEWISHKFWTWRNNKRLASKTKQASQNPIDDRTESPEKVNLESKQTPVQDQKVKKRKDFFRDIYKY